MIQIFVNGSALELSPGENISYSIYGPQIADFSRRRGALTNDFKIPITLHNLEAFQFSDKLEFDQQFAEKKQEAVIKNRTGDIISIGSLQLVDYDMLRQEATFSFFGNISSVISALQGKSIREVDLSAFDHSYTVESIVGSFSNEYTEGFIYPLVDYGRLGGQLTLNTSVIDWYPGVFAAKLLELILQEAGYQVSGSLFDEWEFRRLVCQFSLDRFQVSREYEQLFLGLMSEASQAIQITETVGVNGTSEASLLYNNLQKQDAFNSFDLVNNKYVAPETNTYEGSVAFEVGAASRVELDSTGSVTYQVIFQLLKNGVVFRQRTIQTGTKAASGSVQEDIETQNISISFNEALEKGDEIEARVQFAYQTSIASTQVGLTLNVFNSSFELVSIDRKIKEGDTVTLSSTLPDISQADFITFIFNRFGVLPDLAEGSTDLRLDTIKGVVNNLSQAEDLSEYIVPGVVEKISFVEAVEGYSKVNRFKYLQESEDDTELIEYRDKNLEGLGDGALLIDNDFLTGETDFYEAPFAPTFNRDILASNDAHIAYIPRFNYTGQAATLKANPRILLVTSPVSPTYFSELGLIGSLSITDKNQATTSSLTVPWAYFVKKRLGSGADDIPASSSFGDPFINNPTGGNVLDNWYAGLLDILNRPKVLEVAIKLPSYKLASMYFLTPKYLNVGKYRGYFLLSSIEKYDADTEIGIAKFVYISTSLPVDVVAPSQAPKILPGKIFDLDGVITSQQIALTWSRPGGNPTSYDVYYRLKTDPTYTFWRNETTNSSTVTGLTNALEYEFYVIPLNDLNEPGPLSNILQVTIAGAPDAPVLSLQSGDGQLVATWTTPGSNGEEVLDYELRYRDAYLQGAYTVVSAIEGNTYTILLPEKNGTSYEVDVLARNIIGQGARSSSQEQAPGTVPDQITGLTLESGDQQITATFSDPSGNGFAITKRNIRYRTTGSQSWTEVETITSPHILTGLTNDQEYEVQVQAENALGPGIYSTLVKATPASGFTAAKWLLLVDDAANPETYESAFKASIEALGDEATLANATISASSDFADAYDIVWISPETNTGNLTAANIVALTKGLVLSKRSYGDEANLTTTSSSIGGQGSDDKIRIESDAYTLTGNDEVDDLVDLNDPNYGIGFLNQSVLSSGAVSIANLEGDSSRKCIVYWPSGSAGGSGNLNGWRLFWGILETDGYGNRSEFDTYLNNMLSWAKVEAGIVGGPGGDDGSLPSPLQVIEIGNTGDTDASATHNSGVFSVVSSGERISGTADGMVYVYEPRTGNVQIDLRVTDFQAVPDFAKTGITVRSSLAAGARNFGVYVTPADSGQELRVTFRQEDDDGTTNIQGLLSLTSLNDIYLRVTVNGGTLTAFESSDGVNYTAVGATTMSLPSTYFVGFSAASNDTTETATATIDSYLVTLLDGQGGGGGGSYVNYFSPGYPWAREPLAYGYGMKECFNLWGANGLSMNYVFPTTMQQLADALESTANNIIVPLVGGEHTDTGDFRVRTNKAYLGWLGPGLAQLNLRGGALKGGTDVAERVVLSHLRIRGLPLSGSSATEVNAMEILGGDYVIFDRVSADDWTDGAFDISSDADVDATFRYCLIGPGMDGDRSREPGGLSDIKYHPDGPGHNYALLTYPGSRLTLHGCAIYLNTNRMVFCRLDELEEIGNYLAYYLEKTLEITTSNASGEHIVMLNVSATGPYSKSGARERAPMVYKAKSTHRTFADLNIHRDDRGEFNYKDSTAFDVFQQTVPGGEQWGSIPAGRDSGIDQVDFSSFYPDNFDQRVSFILSQVGPFPLNRGTKDNILVQEALLLNRTSGYHVPEVYTVPSTSQTMQDLYDKGLPTDHGTWDDEEANGFSRFANWAFNQKDIVEGRA